MSVADDEVLVDGDDVADGRLEQAAARAASIRTPTAARDRTTLYYPLIGRYLEPGPG